MHLLDRHAGRDAAEVRQPDLLHPLLPELLHRLALAGHLLGFRGDVVVHGSVEKSGVRPSLRTEEGGEEAGMMTESFPSDGGLDRESALHPSGWKGGSRFFAGRTGRLIFFNTTVTTLGWAKLAPLPWRRGKRFLRLWVVEVTMVVCLTEEESDPWFGGSCDSINWAVFPPKFAKNPTNTQHRRLLVHRYQTIGVRLGL